MQNLLILPVKPAKKTNFLQKIDNFITNYQKKEREKFKKKVGFLYQQTYFYYLKKILKNDCSLDLPHFLYLNGNAINSKALYLTDIAINAAIAKGRKHINRCFKACLKYT